MGGYTLRHPSRTSKLANDPQLVVIEVNSQLALPVLLLSAFFAVSMVTKVELCIWFDHTGVAAHQPKSHGGSKANVAIRQASFAMA